MIRSVSAQEFDPVLLLAWLVALTLLIRGILALHRWRKQMRDRDRRRIEDLVAVATSNRFSAARWAEPPELPVLQILPHGSLPKRCVVAEDGELKLAIIDHSLPEMRPQGMNIEILGGDQTRQVHSRHTFVCLHSPRVLIPEFTVLPRPLEEAHAMVDEFPVGTNTKSREVVAALLRATFAPYDLPNRIQFDELDSNHRALFGVDSAAISNALNSNIIRKIQNCDGLIMEGRDTWVVLSRNVSVSGAEISPRGLLPIHDVSEIVDLARGFISEFAKLSTS